MQSNKLQLHLRKHVRASGGGMARVTAAALFAAAYLLGTNSAGADEGTLLPEGLSSVETLEATPVLLDGRKVPLHTYARAVLLQLSGRRSVDKQPAVDWLTQLFFTPERSVDHKVFLINHPDVAHALDLEKEKRRRYSFAAIQPALGKLGELAEQANALEDDARSPVETEILRLFANVSQYMQLYHAFHFTLPHPDFDVLQSEVKGILGLPATRTEFSFLDVFTRAPEMRDVLMSLEDKDTSEWSAVEDEVFRLSSNLFNWAQRFQNMNVAMIPMDPHGEEVWLSPWDTLRMGIQDPSLIRAVNLLEQVAATYRSGDQAAFDRAAGDFQLAVRSRMKKDRESRYLGLEVWVNKANPLGKAAWFYGFGFFISFLFFLTERRWLFRLTLLLVGVAFIPHTVGILLRMLIMGRPPVTNLYATFVFVGWVCVILGLLLEWVQRRGLGLLASSFGGLSMLMVAGRFFAEGDTMGKVVAVLNSNFWLSTHVVAITTGYAGCVFAGFIGHVYLLHAIFAPGNTERLAAIYRALFGMLGFGLIFSFLGTMLGGVWADQSWGRFWGWDPKENGALLIVLWCAILFHARMARMIGPRGVAAGSVLGVIVVLMAWLGVNLLSVGLHNYGFTSGLAAGFYCTVAFEGLFVALTVPFARGDPGIP